MKKTLTLNEYVRLGGDLTKLNMNQITLTFPDQYKYSKILYIVKVQHHMLYTVTFIGNDTKVYSGDWLEVDCDFILDPKYK